MVLSVLFGDVISIAGSICPANCHGKISPQDFDF